MNIDPIYNPTLWAMVVTGLLILIQLLVADFSAIKIKHVAGTPLQPDPKNFVFRAARAHANTNESVACFMLFTVVGILANADSLWLNSFAWLYVICRIGHMLFYYLHKKALRSTAFGISLAALLSLFIICTVALLN